MDGMKGSCQAAFIALIREMQRRFQRLARKITEEVKAMEQACFQRLLACRPMTSYYSATPRPERPKAFSYYAQEVRRRNRALRDELRGADVEGILNLAARRGQGWDTVSVSTALHAFACKVKQKAQRPNLSDARWQHLKDLALQRLASGEARNLANTAWAMACISCREKPFLDLSEELVYMKAAELKPQEVSNLAWAFATLRYGTAPLMLFLVQEQIEDFSCQDAANTMWSLAALSLALEGVMHRLLPCASKYVFEFKPQECANSIWAMAILSCQDELAKSITIQATLTLAEFRTQNLSNFIWAYAKLGYKDEDVALSVLQMSLRSLSTFSAQDLTTTLWAFATMQHRVGDTFVAAALHELQKRAESTPLQPQHVSNTAWSLASLSYTHAPAFDFMCLSMHSRIREFKPQEAANFMWSFATTMYKNQPAVACIVGRIRTIVQECSCQSTANFVWSYAKLGFSDERVIEFIEASERARIYSLSEQDLSTSIWAFSTMLHRSDEFINVWMAAASQKLRDGPIKPQHASNMLWALASVFFYDAPFYGLLAESVKKSVRGFAPQDLACCLWSCATVVYRDQELTELLAAEASRQLQSFDPQSVGNAAWGAAYLRASDALHGKVSELIGDDSSLMRFNEKVLAMVTRALMTFEPEQAWRLFQRLRQLDIDPGINALSLWLHHCRDLQPSILREMEALSMLAWFQPCRHVQLAVLKAAALRLAEMGFCHDAKLLLQDLLRVSEDAIAQGVLQKLLCGHFTERHSPLQLTWKMPTQPLGHTGTSYDKQCRLLQHVLATAQVGDAWSVVNTIERFSIEGNGWLKIAGGGKGVVLDDLIRSLAPQPPSLVLEFGCFVGYSSTRMAYWLRRVQGKVISVEVDPIHACIARNVIEFAGVADHVDICIGYSEDVIPHLKNMCAAQADAIFFDQRGTRFHTDLWMLEAESLLKPGCAVLADNVLKPGAPHFLWYLQHSPKYDFRVVSLREFAADRIEDWMAVALFKGREESEPKVLPKALDKVAFLTDKARARSCNADGPCEVDEDAWARHSQEIRRAYQDVHITPRILHVKCLDGRPFVDWSAS
ncbi:unnamed protein product [Effrenium voratum]|uniref:RNA-editing substrate-binding complex 6 protein domain-containing protein n=1 Tax=Effrenium voratum TaxID=2562239 RepID=A0AA36I9D4_9DINO|nr:unnamed protein product [Effrenium voratum]